MSYRERMTARIVQTRRAAKRAEAPAAASSGEPVLDELHALQARVAHLEALVEGLQDSVHRESSREDKRISELEARIQPGTLGKALSDDARARGL